MGKIAEYRELARQIINERKFEKIEQFTKVFEQLDTISWWDKMLMDQISNKCSLQKNTCQQIN